MNSKFRKLKISFLTEKHIYVGFTCNLYPNLHSFFCCCQLYNKLCCSVAVFAFLCCFVFISFSFSSFFFFFCFAFSITTLFCFFCLLSLYYNMDYQSICLNGSFKHHLIHTSKDLILTWLAKTVFQLL